MDKDLMKAYYGSYLEYHSLRKHYPEFLQHVHLEDDMKRKGSYHSYNKRIKHTTFSLTLNGGVGHSIDIIGDCIDVSVGVYYGNQHVWCYIRTGNLPRKHIIDINTRHTVINTLEKIERWCAGQRIKMQYPRL